MIIQKRRLAAKNNTLSHNVWGEKNVMKMSDNKEQKEVQGINNFFIIIY